MRCYELMFCLLLLALLGVGSGSRGADCNGNGVDDLQDLKPREFGFVTTPTIPMPGLSRSCSRLIPADLDGDLDLDLIGARCAIRFNSPEAESSILINQGTGAFAPGGGFGYPGDVVAADFDLDGGADLASARYGILTLYHSQDGQLEQEGTEYSGDFAPLLEASDLNGDSYVDLITMTRTSGEPFSLSVLLNQGNGAFEPGGGLVDTALVWLPRFLAAADIDGDQDPDLLVSHVERDLTGLYVVDVLLFFNNGEGTFERKGEFNAGPCAVSVAAADLDEDGTVDLAFASSSFDGQVLLHLNTGEGTFKTPVIFPTRSSPSAIAAADLDRDGHFDLAVALGKSCGSIVPGGDLVTVLLGHGDGTFGAPLDYIVGSSSASLAAADLDRDGFPDLAVGNDGGVTVLLNQAVAPWSFDLDRNGIPDECDTRFNRGDPSSSGTIDTSDGLAIFASLFLGDPPVLSCKESADSNDDGALDLSDGIYLFNHLFLGGPPPAAPGPPPAPCGVDPDPPGSLGCMAYLSCE
jgi:hypothetical protein